MTVTALPPAALLRAYESSSVVVLQGELDLFTEPAISKVLSRVINLYAGDVVVDLAEVEFIDTATMRLLATAQQALDRKGRTLTFRSPPRLAIRLLALFDLTDLIETREALRV